MKVNPFGIHFDLEAARRLRYELKLKPLLQTISLFAALSCYGSSSVPVDDQLLPTTIQSIMHGILLLPLSGKVIAQRIRIMWPLLCLFTSLHLNKYSRV